MKGLSMFMVLLILVIILLGILTECTANEIMVLPEDGNSFVWEVIPGEESQTKLQFMSDHGEILVEAEMVTWEYDRNTNDPEYALVKYYRSGEISAVFHLHVKTE